MNIKSSQFVKSSVNLSQCPSNGLPEYAFIGRSNVGKSSLINAITNNKNLCKTSSMPGKTLTINHFLINDSFYIVDLPGYGFAKIGLKERQHLDNMISSYIINRKELRKLYVLLDSRHDLMNIDAIFIENVLDLDLEVAFVLTKADKLTTSKISAQLKNFGSALKALGAPDDMEIFCTSAEKKYGLENFVFD